MSMAMTENTVTAITTILRIAICAVIANSFPDMIFALDTGCASKNSAVCSFSSFASAEIPSIAAKNAPPSPNTLPHSTLKNPANSPKLILSIPNACEKLPIPANISLTSPI